MQEEPRDYAGPYPERRISIDPNWQPHPEKHWYNYLIAVLLLVISMTGWFLIDTLEGVRQGILEVKGTVDQIETRLIQVEKKLEAVATDEALLRKTVERHMDKGHD